MNISLDKKDEVRGKLTVKLEKADYQPNIDKSLKQLKQKINMPGFRRGMVPMGMVTKMYGMEVKVEEVNKTLSTAVNDYIQNEKLNLLVNPMMGEDQPKLDIEASDDFEFYFDLAVAPKVEIDLSEKDTVDYYDIEIDDKAVDDQVNASCRQGGKYEEVDAFNHEDDLLRGDLVELNADGTVKEGGLNVESASLMPKYFTDDEQKALFKDSKKDSDVIFNVSKAYGGNDTEISSLLKIKKEEVNNHLGDFKYHLVKISHFVPAELNQDLFDYIYGKDNVKNEQEMREKIKADLQATYERDSDYKFLLDLRDYAIKKVGELQFPEEMLKRYLLDNAKKEEDKKNIDDLLKKYIQELTWSLISTQMAKNLKIEINEAALKETAREMVRIQFSQYGINNVPEDALEKYSESMLNDEKQRDTLISRTLDHTLTKAAKTVVNLSHKNKTIEDFNKMFEPVEAK